MQLREAEFLRSKDEQSLTTLSKLRNNFKMNVPQHEVEKTLNISSFTVHKYHQNNLKNREKSLCGRDISDNKY